MDPLHVVTFALIVVFVAVTLPFWREKYGDRYDNDRDFLKDHRPRMWGLIDGVQQAKADAIAAPGLCRACGMENDPSFDYCGECGARLPG